MSTKHGVSVACRNVVVRSAIGITTNQEIFVKCISDLIPDGVFVISDALHGIELSGGSSQDVESLSLPSEVGELVVSIELGPDLFDHGSPHVPIGALSVEDQTSIVVG